MKKISWCSVLLAVLVFSGVTLAQAPPVANINPQRFPNLAAAQQHIIQAYQSAEAARADNKDQLGGHAEKAVVLLIQADQELKAAAEYAEHRK